MKSFLKLYIIYHIKLQRNQKKKTEKRSGLEGKIGLIVTNDTGSKRVKEGLHLMELQKKTHGITNDFMREREVESTEVQNSELYEKRGKKQKNFQVFL